MSDVQHTTHPSASFSTAVINRVLGVGLTAALSVVTSVLWATDTIALYINPDGAVFAVIMASLALIGCVGSFAIPLGAENEHDHDHGDSGSSPTSPRRRLGAGLVMAGGIIAVIVTGAALVLPAASLSAQTAIDRDLGFTPLFGGDDVIALATTGDTATFGVAEWARVFSATADARLYDGAEVTLTGFITPSMNSQSGIQLTRLVVTHCVIDAQPASVPLSAITQAPDTGQWVTITGTITTRDDGELAVTATSVENVGEPTDPYEY